MSSLTDSVARLYRAGSEHSRQWKKLNQAAVELVRWLGEHAPIEEELPDKCRIKAFYCDGQQYELLATEKTFRILTSPANHRVDLLRFGELIADGWLDKMSEWLESWAKKYAGTTAAIETSMENAQERP